MKQIYKYYNDTYTSKINLLICDFDTANNILKNKFHLNESGILNDKNLDGCALQIINNNNKINSIIWIPSFNFFIEDYVTLSHECLHTAIRILDRHDVVCITNTSSEQLNYLHDAIYRNFLIQLHKDYKKQNN